MADQLTPQQRARIGLWIRLARCYNLAMRDLRASLRDECTMPQFDVLAQLNRSDDGLTFSALSRKLLVTAGNLTGIVDRLEKQGLVRRETNPEDRRQTFIKLTDEGREYCGTIIPGHERAIADLFADLGENTVHNLRSDLADVARMLEREREQAS